MLDIPKEDVERVDASHMMRDVLGLPEQIERAQGAARATEVALPRAPRSVVLAGLGGSAITGDYLAHLLALEGAVPAVVTRDYTLPAWASEETLVLCASYSGTTEETLSAFVEAKKRGCMIAAASTGGKLEEYAKRAGAPFLVMEPGLQPRAAIGTSLVPQAWVLESTGLLKLQDAISQAVPGLKGLAKDLAPDAPPDRNEAKRFALALHGTTPFVYASEFLAPVARRWSNQFNENSKILSAWGVMPEMNHNETVGWSGEEKLDAFTGVFLRHPDTEHPQTRERFDFTVRMIQERGGSVIQYQPPGEGVIGGMLATTFVGDAASVYLAALRGVDPSPVEVIKDLKARVGGTGFAKALDERL